MNKSNKEELRLLAGHIRYEETKLYTTTLDNERNDFIKSLEKVLDGNFETQTHRDIGKRCIHYVLTKMMGKKYGE